MAAETSARRSQRQAAAKSAEGRTTISVPYITAQLHTRQVEVPLPRVPGREQISSATESVRSQLPSRDQALFYGGLAAGAAFSLLEWPVALAIGFGYALVQRTRRQEEQRSSQSS
jgi:hypothetical protein